MASIPSDEARLRQQLTDFYHLVDYFGWSELIFNHISGSCPTSWCKLVSVITTTSGFSRMVMLPRRAG